MQQPHILSSNALTLYVHGVPRTIHRDDTRFNKAIDLLRTGDFDSLATLMQPAQAVQQALDLGMGAATGIELRNGALYLDGQLLGDEDYTVRQILDFHATDLPTEPLVAFYTRLCNNPSYRVRRDLLRFLEVGQLPITEDGFFMAYKRVNADFTDCHTGRLSYAPGSTVSMPREAVDDDPNNTCSHGLHVCSYGYLAHFSGAKVISVKVDPADVVSIPTDYDNTKMRVCSLTSVEEIPVPQEHNVWGGPVVFRRTDEFGVTVIDRDEEDDEEEDVEPKYNVGTEVTVVDCANAIYIGKRGVIYEIDHDDTFFPYLVALVGENDGTWFREEEISPLPVPVPAQPQPAVTLPMTGETVVVGDRVRFTYNSHATVVIEQINPQSIQPLFVRFDDGSSGWFSSSGVRKA